MAYREVHCVEIREVIRRWQAGLSQRRIAGGTGVSRPTVRRYIEAAEAPGLSPAVPSRVRSSSPAWRRLSRTGHGRRRSRASSCWRRGRSRSRAG